MSIKLYIDRNLQVSRQSNEEVQVKRAVSRPYMEVEPIHESGTELSVITRYDPYKKNWLGSVYKPLTLNKHSMTCVFMWSKWLRSTFCSLKTTVQVLPSPLAGPLNWVLRGSRAMFPTSLVSGIIRLEWYALEKDRKSCCHISFS